MRQVTMWYSDKICKACLSKMVTDGRDFWCVSNECRNAIKENAEKVVAEKQPVQTKE